MLPYFMILPVWLLVAIVLPLAQTLHALQNKTADRKMWLFYWISYVAACWLLHYFEWLVSIPFYVLSFYIDLYYEAMILLVFWLVFPKFLGIRLVQRHLETNATMIDAVVKEKVKDVAQVLYGKFNEVKEKYL
mmetsp:Transcript_35331/g.101467  ORF Transcript_35331/g.101467 Transcript_35331/m.101467 type:complete len:133 (-) Transcript_35331:103-501(-)